MPSYGSHVWMPDFTPAIYQRVVDRVPQLTRDRVFSSLRSDDDHCRWPPADKFVTGFFSNFPVDQRMVGGGGLYNTAFDAALVLTAFVRLDADPELASTRQLEDEADGVWQLLQKIIAALQTWDGPTNDDGLQVFRRPMRIAPGFQVHKRAADTGRWAVAPMTFECSFVADLGYSFAGAPL